MFDVGDKLTVKGSRDSVVYEIERIIPSFGKEALYELRPLGGIGGRTRMTESMIKEKYIKIN